MELGGVVWLCVTVTLYLDGEALGFNKAQLSEQTDFIRRQAGSWTFSARTVWIYSRGRCRLSADFLCVCGKAARNVTRTHAGRRTVWHLKPSRREVTQEQQGLKQRQKKKKNRPVCYSRPSTRNNPNKDDKRSVFLRHNL